MRQGERVRSKAMRSDTRFWSMFFKNGGVGMGAYIYTQYLGFQENYVVKLHSRHLWNSVLEVNHHTHSPKKAWKVLLKVHTCAHVYVCLCKIYTPALDVISIFQLSTEYHCQFLWKDHTGKTVSLWALDSHSAWHIHLTRATQELSLHSVLTLGPRLLEWTLGQTVQVITIISYFYYLFG